MRHLLSILVILAVAALAVAGYVPSEIGGPIGARGGPADLRITAMVAADGAWPIVHVSAEPGFEQGLAVYVPGADEVHGYAAAQRHRQRIIPAVAVAADDLLRVIVRGADGTDSLTYRDDQIKVLRGGGLGIVVEPWLAANGLPPSFAVQVSLGYEIGLSVYARLVTDEGVGHTYADHRYLAAGDTSASVHSWLFQLGEQYAAFAGDSLYVLASVHYAGHDSLAFERAFELAVAPGTPENLVAVPGDNAVTLVWNPPTGDFEVAGYRIYRKEGHSGVPAQLTYRASDYFTPTSLAGIGYNPADFAYWYDPSSHRWHIMGIDKTTAWSSDPDAERWWPHWSSADHVTWTRHADLWNYHLRDGGTDEAPTIDGHPVRHIWAPHVVLSGETWHLYFTGVDRTTYSQPARNIQRIFEATAPLGADLSDPAVWSDPRFLLNGDCAECPGLAGSIVGATGWALNVDWRANCRDPFVIWDDSSEQWVMLLTLTRAAGSNALAVGAAVADDLAGDWTLLGVFGSGSPTLTPLSYLKGESAAAFKQGSDYVVIFSESAYSGFMKGPSALGPFTYSSLQAAWHLHFLGVGIEPLAVPVERPGGVLLEAWPQWRRIKAVPIATMGAGQYGLSAVANLTINGTNRTVRGTGQVGTARWRQLTPFDLVTTTYFEDYSASPDSTLYRYAVSTVFAGGQESGFSGLEDVTTYWEPNAGLTVEYRFLSDQILSRVSVVPVWSMTPETAEPVSAGVASDWRVRYRELASSSEISCEDLESVSWSSWIPRTVGQPIFERTYTTPTEVGDWYAFEAQIVTEAALAPITLCDRLQRVAPPPTPVAPTTLVVTRDTADFVLHWSREPEDLEEYYRHYRIEYRRRFPPSSWTTWAVVVDELAPTPGEGPNEYRHVGGHAEGSELTMYRVFAVYDYDGTPASAYAEELYDTTEE